MLPNFSVMTFDHSLGGTFDRDPRAVLWHTTEGGTVAGAVSVYKSKLACPHMTVDFDTKEKFQHVPLDRSAYGLQRGDATHVCGVQTNRSGIIQIEVVGYAADAWSWSPERLEWLGVEVLKPILEACPTIPRGPVYSGPRMNEYLWDVWSGGQCGHRDVCCQPAGHTDPGDLDLAAILAYATGDNMALTDDDVERIADAVWLRVVKNVPGEDGALLPSAPIENVLGWAYIQALRAHLAVADLAKVAITTGPVDPHGGV